MNIDPISFMAGGLASLVIVVILIMLGTLTAPMVPMRLLKCAAILLLHAAMVWALAVTHAKNHLISRSESF